MNCIFCNQDVIELFDIKEEKENIQHVEQYFYCSHCNTVYRSHFDLVLGDSLKPDSVESINYGYIGDNASIFNLLKAYKEDSLDSLKMLKIRKKKDGAFEVIQENL